MKKVLELEEGWEIIQNGITKLINILEGVPDESPIYVEEGWKIIHNEFTEKVNIHEGVPESPLADGNFSMKMYDIIFTMCTQLPHNHSEQVYKRYEDTYKNYLQSIVLPAIEEKHDDASMLQEVVKRWENHKFMVKKLSRCFSYLDRYYIHRKGLPEVKAVGFNCFGRIVGEKMKDRVKDAANREGEEIDQTLIKNALDIFVELENPRNMKDDPPKYESYSSFNDDSWLMFPGYDSWLGYDSPFPGYDPTDRLFF